MKNINQYSSDKTKTLVETAIYRVSNKGAKGRKKKEIYLLFSQMI
ncbi:hypothetical protein GXM_04926 [Nostoc sphaeroides CCNUC1]|uniref:Uncharacterized protein n=1 Tax=Nostoc sphaeroides CCNUC1 TaxID=2653204 RepID=A0A5P8W476_9NOSO|nr:hypothetical protein GXM_04926 [Nostoc sphaeroides CCNUC1]